VPPGAPSTCSASRTPRAPVALPAALPAPAPLVIGSDLLYEARHIPALVCAIGALCAPGGAAVIADPGRDNLPRFVTAMERLGWRTALIPVDDIYVCRFTRTE
jgi:hypothetical protein